MQPDSCACNWFLCTYQASCRGRISVILVMFSSACCESIPLAGRETGKVCASMPGGFWVKYRATSCLLPLLATSSAWLSGVHAAPQSGCAPPCARQTAFSGGHYL